MKVDRFSKSVLALIALSLCVIALRSSPAPAVQTSAPTAPAYGDIEFIPQGQFGFIALNRRDGKFAYYQLNAPNNQWKWEKLGPTGDLAALGTPPPDAQP